MSLFIDTLILRRFIGICWVGNDDDSMKSWR